MDNEDYWVVDLYPDLQEWWHMDGKYSYNPQKVDGDNDESR